MSSHGPTPSSAETGQAPLSVRGLTCMRDDRILFEGLSFELAAGSLLRIEGANGAGKTSLLRLLCGLGWAEEGQILWHGRDIRHEQTEYLQAMSYCGHIAGLGGDLTVVENLAFSQRLRNSSGALTMAQVIQTVGLAGFADNRVRTLSAGQTRRVALARVLLSNAQLWILDEPFTALDQAGRELVQHLLGAHVSAGGMAIVSTHHPLLLDEQVRQQPLRLG